MVQVGRLPSGMRVAQMVCAGEGFESHMCESLRRFVGKPNTAETRREIGRLVVGQLQLIDRLAHRLKYRGGRKARSALRRLRRMHLWPR
jgi:hypothetical protein